MMPSVINQFWPRRSCHTIQYAGSDGKDYIVYVPPWLLNTVITPFRAKGIELRERK